MVHHNKQVEGTERIFKFLSGHYRVTGEWEDFLYTGQLLQAEALKCAVEHWRRRKFRTAGALFWQLNDCWPVTSWSVIDSALRPKAAYYAARRFFAPLLVSFAPVEGGLEVWGTSDFLTPVEGRLNVRLQTFGGKVLASTTMPLRLPANSSERLFAIPAAWRKKGGDYMRAEITDRGRPISVNRFLFAEPKDCAFPTARVRVGLEKLGPASYRAVLSSNVFALGVVLSSPGNGVQFHDNFVDLDAGVAHEIAIASRLSLARLRKSLTVKALNGETANQ
jgi:beta-mannosidase